MPLSPDETKKLEAILMALDGLDLPGSANQFIKDQGERYEKYGADMWLSEKQWAWLTSLYEKNVGTLDAI
jgi:hypothetical protein